jgi:probable HAF family extracellular repeat protein
MKARIRTTILFCAALALLVRGAVLAVSYSLTDIGTLGGSRAGAGLINESGQLAGTSQTVANDPTTQHAFRWDAVNGIQDLGTLGGRSSSATGMNESGQVVGTSLLAGDTIQHAFLFDTSIHDLGTLGDSSDQSSATTITNSGMVIGQSTLTA